MSEEEEIRKAQYGCFAMIVWIAILIAAFPMIYCTFEFIHEGASKIYHDRGGWVKIWKSKNENP
jgi:hypothetical protein